MGKNKVRIVAAITALVLFVFGTSRILSILMEQSLATDEYETTRKQYVTEMPKEDSTGDDYKITYIEPDNSSLNASAITEDIEESKSEEDNSSQQTTQIVIDDSAAYPNLSIDNAGLAEANSDYVGWLYFSDGNISLPVVQERQSEVDKYLKTTFEGRHNSAGCLFMEYNADAALRYNNTFIYGHNMKNDSMFGLLDDLYLHPEKYTDPYFYFFMPDSVVKRYRIIAIYVVDKSSTMYSIPVTETEYDNYMQAAMYNGIYNKVVEFTVQDKLAMSKRAPIMTLSTCYGAAGTSKRLLVQGILISEQTYK
ncbi:class B sortase [Butyrivibrio fibrisolvens]|uniref:class B sortase n=1 Tax=Butyrivibrio fibrisolvens TaxID=831 RepID=UPI0003B6E95D|nr:class B sortase [Butyrivibrio fibrisolvens]